MRAEDFIALAGKLAAANTDAASCRTAIGRAYYGAFHVARDFLKSLNIHVPRTDNAHLFFQRRLGNCGVDDVKVASRLLADLHLTRIEADYKLSAVDVEAPANARACVEKASRFVAIMAGCDTPDVKTRITSGITDYERKLGG